LGKPQSVPLLGYDKYSPLSVTFDASLVGLGAVLVHKQSNGPRVILYANHTLTVVESRYSRTEIEVLSLVWGRERFTFYLYGKQFYLFTDHKSLEVISGP
jgi:hypothetical protein